MPKNPKIELTPENYLENAIIGATNVSEAVQRLQSIREQLVAKKAERKASFMNIFATTKTIKALRSERGAQKRFMKRNKNGLIEITDKVCELPTSKKGEQFSPSYFDGQRAKSHSR